MKRKLTPIIIMIIMIVWQACAIGSGRLLDFDNHKYYYAYWFNSLKNENQIFDMLFNAKQFHRSLPKAEKFQVFTRNDSTYDIDYRNRILACVFTVTKKACPKMVVAEVKKFSHSSEKFPDLVSLKLEYKLLNSGNSIEIQTVQRAFFDSNLSRAQSFVIRTILDKFSNRLADYIETDYSEENQFEKDGSGKKSDFVIPNRVGDI